MKRGKKRKFIQAARERMERKGTVGSYGHHSVRQMESDVHAGGKRGKKAQFALNTHRIQARKKKRHGGRSSGRS